MSFEDFTTNPALSNGAIQKEIRFSSQSDLFASFHDRGVKLAVGRNIGYLLVAGMRCNLWIPAFFEELKSASVIPILISDARASQLPNFTTHNEAILHFNGWLQWYGYSTVDHWDILIQKPLAGSDQVIPDGNKNAFYFDWFCDLNR
jgi:hypothetical protein